MFYNISKMYLSPHSDSVAVNSLFVVFPIVCGVSCLVLVLWYIDRLKALRSN